MNHMLDAIDMYVLLKVVALKGNSDWSQGRLAAEIGVSPATVNQALKRASEARLYDSANKRVNSHSMKEALVHGIRYFMAAKRSGEVRGTPTAWAAPPLNSEISSSEVMPPVWPNPMGETRGWSVEPLHPSAPKMAVRDPEFYAVLALVDALRLGGNRERSLASKELDRILNAKQEQR